MLPVLATTAGVAGMVGAWVAVGVLAGSSASWLALVGAADVALLLRLTRAPPGPARTGMAVLATGVIAGASQWLLAATRMGMIMGLEPLASATRLGPALGWQVVQLGLDRVDWVLLVASLPLAAILVESGRDPTASP